MRRGVVDHQAEEQAAGRVERRADQLMADETLAALFLDSASNPLDVRIELGKAEREKKGAFVLPVVVRLPLSKLALIPQELTHEGGLSLIVVVQDEKGRISPPIKIAVPVKISHEKLPSALNQLVGYRTKLRVRPGEQKIAVGVRDDVSQLASTVNLRVSIGDI